LTWFSETPKSQTAVLIVLIALEDSDTNSALLAKALDVKEPRFAQADAVQAALGAKPADGAFSYALFTRAESLITLE
jgi:prolyl-tRNA synthetase